MKRNIIITIIAILLIFLAISYSRSRDVEMTDNTKLTTEPNGERVINLGEPQPADAVDTTTKIVSGKIIEKDDSCFSDGICKINVSGTWVITNQGWYQGPLGTVAPDLVVGMNIEAYGKVTSDGSLTMLGSNDYYIKLK